MRLLPLFFILAAAGCLSRSAKLPPTIPAVKGDKRALYALEYIDVVKGTGQAVGPRQCVYAHYTGWLLDGTKFDSSRDTTANGTPREPISFPIGYRRVILGWDSGFEGMHVGGHRRLLIPYHLAYGENGRPPVIPERAPLIFDVELMAVADTVARIGAPVNSTPSCASWSAVSDSTR